MRVVRLRAAVARRPLVALVRVLRRVVVRRAVVRRVVALRASVRLAEEPPAPSSALATCCRLSYSATTPSSSRKRSLSCF